MKKILLLIATVALSLPITACSCNAEFESETRNKYTITATYDGAQTVTADMTFDYCNATDSIVDTLYFHLYPAAYRSDARFPAVPKSEQPTAYPSGVNYGGIVVNSVQSPAQINYEIEGQDEDILIITTDPIEPTESVSVDINFTLTLPEIRHRFGTNEGRVNLGNWYPILCASGENGVDTSPYYDRGDPFFSDVADYDVTLILPSGYTAATSGSEQTQITDNSVEIRSKSEKIRDFAAVIGKFDTVSKSVNGVKITYFYQKDETPNENLTAAANAISTFSDLFGAYPYPDYDVVETALLHGGMEYPRLSLISDATADSLQTEVVVHETAHQWWYGVVGNDQINHAWLDEGLAEYSTTLFYEKNPNYNVSRAARMSDATSAYMVYLDITLSKSTAMNRRLPDFETQTDYSFLTYVKGALMFDSVRTSVGDDKFFAALKRYYAENKFGIATPASLYGAFERECGSGIVTFFDSWTSGKDVACK